jgi:hypothetical protein
MTTTTTHPATVSELSDMVAAFYDTHDATPPARATYDAVALALGVADTCTGNSDTAADSVTHTPKTGLSVAFYTVDPTHRTEEGRPLTAYYSATWNGCIYRGHVILSNRGYHADEPRGFVCFDQSSYSETLPAGCRALVAALVSDAVIESGVSLEDMRGEWAAAATYYEISAHVHKAKMAMYDASRVENRGK